MASSVTEAARLSGHCFNCGRELTDPVSLERGIGPECIVRKIANVWTNHDLGCDDKTNAFSTGMSEDFVVATLKNPRPLYSEPLDSFPLSHFKDGRVQVYRRDGPGVIGTFASLAKAREWIDAQPPVVRPRPREENDEAKAYGPQVLIRGLDDVTPVPTPVTITSSGRLGPEERTEQRLLAKLYTHEMPPRRVTVVLSGAYGGPFVKVGKLVSAVINAQSAAYSSRWGFDIGVTPNGKRKADYYTRHFPTDTLLAAWGWHEISLEDLPELTAPIRWHCENYAATWREMARRLHAAAGADVWMDTIEAAVRDHAARHT